MDSLELRFVHYKSPETVSVPNGFKDGITYNKDGSITFVHALSKKMFSLLCVFNDWKVHNDYLLNKSGDEVGEKWWKTFKNIPSDKGKRFQYVVDGEIR